MKKFVVFGLAILFLFVLQGLVLAAPVTIADPGGQSEATVRDGLIGAPNGIKMQTGSGVVYTGACRVLSVSLYGATAGDTIGIYNTSAAEQAQYKIGPYPIEDLEFELGISANTSNAPTWDAKGAKFNFGIKILATVSTTKTSVIFDY